MNRRVIAAIVAAVFAMMGAGLLATYVSTADQRAIAGAKPVDVFVVAKPIAKGTPADALGDAIVTKQIPRMALAAEVVTDLKTIAGRVASTDLVVGEQVLASRFVDPLQFTNDVVVVPPGMQQVSVLMKADEARGGMVKPGDVVAFLVTVDAPDGPSAAPGGAAPQPGKITKTVLQQVLVTRVQGSSSVPTDQSGTTTSTAAPEKAPSGDVIITVALNVGDTEKLIWSSRAGVLNLAVQTPDTPSAGGGKPYTSINEVVLR